MNYHCELHEQPAQLVASIRTRSSVDKLCQMFGRTYSAIIQYLNETGVQPTGSPFAVYYNMDMQDLDIEAGFPIATAVPGKNDIKTNVLPAGKQVSCLHTGPYNQVEPAYNALMKWIDENGYQSTGVCYEFYINDPRNTPESQLQTRIVFPLK